MRIVVDPARIAIGECRTVINDATEIQFTPSAVGAGWDRVAEVWVRPDRLIVRKGSCFVVIRFVEIARWHRRSWLYRPLAKLGGPIWGAPFVAERDWCRDPATSRYFRFYTDPPLKIFMPEEPTGTPYHESLFIQIQQVISSGGFTTFDLG